MSNFSLSSLLLFALVIPFIMTYRLGPGQIVTPYWLFGIIFAFLLSNLGLDLVSWSKQRVKKLKNIFPWLLIILVIGSAYTAAISVRQRTSPTYQVHDMVIQQEAAIRYLLQRKNPYSMTYFNTPLEEWHYSDTEVNPALFHFVMMPWYLLFALPFYAVSISVFGFFDARLPLVFLFGLLLALIWCLRQSSPERRRLFLILLAFNPATLGYFLEGRSDVFMFSFLVWGWYLLQQKRYALAGIPVALALATKQSAWPILPFYLGFLWLKAKKDWRLTTRWLAPLIVTAAVIILPFFAWDPKAFLDSTIFYLAGSTAHSYPIAGYGWGMVLNQLGVIGDLNARYPFWLWQLATCLPLAVVLWRWLSRRPSVARLIAAYGILTMVFWYFSRYFNNSHLGYLSMVFLTAHFWPENR